MSTTLKLRLFTFGLVGCSIFMLLFSWQFTFLPAIGALIWAITQIKANVIRADAIIATCVIAIVIMVWAILCVIAPVEITTINSEIQIVK